jgi:hypothetical protein
MPETKNLDIYGHAPLEWSRVLDQLADTHGPDMARFLGTTNPDGTPHSAGIGAIWAEDAMWIVSGPGTRKSRNLQANPACTLSLRMRDLDLVLEGEAERVTDGETLERIAAVYRDVGWPAQVEGDAFTAPYSAPSAGPPPWHLYRVTIRTAFAVASGEPAGATRWRF